jgi:hypothetical protein
MPGSARDASPGGARVYWELVGDDLARMLEPYMLTDADRADLWDRSGWSPLMDSHTLRSPCDCMRALLGFARSSDRLRAKYISAHCPCPLPAGYGWPHSREWRAGLL